MLIWASLPLELNKGYPNSNHMFTHCMTYDDLPQIIPVFPLEGALLLPGGLLPLNIFEEKYIRMVDDALSTHRMIGIVQPDIQNNNSLYSVGCVGRITSFTELEDDRYNIILKGVSRFDAREELTTISPYRSVHADWTDYKDDLVEDCETIEIDRDEFIPLLKRYFIIHRMNCDWDLIDQTRCETLLTALPMICPFASEEQQALLEAKTLDDRYNILTTMLKIALQSNKMMDNVKH